ncbi:MAG: hypothetical protein DID92_2727743521 [Candidatus Nitrotoga sp. SPKER]|nr:MAG: hypothetical protein DID92_2727743521 [Candidatus Nitrotoga sp. SPKER]
MIKTSNMRLAVTLIVVLLVGASTSEAVYAAGGWRGGGGWYGGGGWRGGGGWNRGGRVGIYLGAPIGFNFGYGYSPYSYYGPSYYGSPYYYPPAPVYYPPVQPAPVVYTERRDDPPIRTQEAPRNLAQNVQTSWWYYCVDSNGYYPYVNKCPGGWLRVAPQPAPDSDDQPTVNNVSAP